MRAPLSIFSRLRADSFTAQVDASGAQAGDNDNLPITVNSTDPDVHAADPEPGTARLHLEEIQPRSAAGAREPDRPGAVGLPDRHADRRSGAPDRRRARPARSAARPKRWST